MKNLVFALLFLFLLFSGFSDNQIWVKAKMPVNVHAGDRFTVELTINKLDLQNFAEFKQTLPAGFTAFEKQSGNAGFSFKNQTVKFSWVRLPRSPLVTISYDVLVKEDVKGQFSLPGQFTYIYKNQRGTAQIENDKINVFSKGERFVNNNNQTENTGLNFPPKDAKAIQCIRIRPQFLPKYNAYTVTLLVSMGNIQGKSKIEEIIPDGYIASLIETKGGTFTFDNNKVEIIWNKIPASTNIEISYKLVPKSSKSPRLAISGRFIYISNGMDFSVPIQETEREMLNKTNDPNKSDVYNYFNN
jgi:hypothetical protein